MGSDCISSWSLLIFLLFYIETFEVYQLQVGTLIADLVSTCTNMSTRGQDHCLTLVQSYSGLFFQTSAPKLLDTTKAYFVWSLYDRGTEFVQMMKVNDQNGCHAHIWLNLLTIFFSKSKWRNWWPLDDLQVFLQEGQICLQKKSLEIRLARA